MSRRWIIRLGALAAIEVGVLVAFRLTGARPDAVRAVLVIALLVVLTWLVSDTLTDAGPPWTTDSPGVTSVLGSDTRLRAYARMVEDQLVAREESPVLRDRLARLAEDRLLLHRGVTLADPVAADLLGPELFGLLTGPPSRWSSAELDLALTRIEEL